MLLSMDFSCGRPLPRRRHGQSQLLEPLDPQSLDELELLSLFPQLLEQWLLDTGSWLRRRQSSSLS